MSETPARDRSGSFEIAKGVPALHTTPILRLLVLDNAIQLTLDDELERPIVFTLKPFQAVRVTTIDCFDPSHTPQLTRRVLSATRSEWIDQLRASLAQTDESARFLDRSLHYLFPCQDNVVEIVSWPMSWSLGESSGDSAAGQ